MLPDHGFIVECRNHKTCEALKNKSLANILLADFIPKDQILGDPRTLAFISHGDENSINSATYNGVPIIGYPFKTILDNSVLNSGHFIYEKEPSPEELVKYIKNLP